MNKHVSEEHTEIAKKILESVGIVHQVGEYQLNAFTGLSGSGPAYVSAIELAPRDQVFPTAFSLSLSFFAHV